jgi:hypothetical protein
MVRRNNFDMFDVRGKRDRTGYTNAYDVVRHLNAPPSNKRSSAMLIALLGGRAPLFATLSAAD